MRESVPTARYSPVCNVLRQWKTLLILTLESTDSMIFQAIRRARAVNAQRANVGPAG